MNSGEVFINYQMSKRVMRRTHSPKKLLEIYSKKYANWIVPFLKEYGVEKAPSMLCCHTLHQLPAFFKIHPNCVFVADYYLHLFLYDLNFCLCDQRFEEYLVNLYIKTYAEKAFLNKRIEMCYYLCLTSDGLEEYKLEANYRDDSLMTQLVEQTDIQEEFTFLHEAAHYLVTLTDDIKKTDIYQTLKVTFSSVIDLELDDDFYEESYCDYLGVVYILNKSYHKTELSHELYFTLLFRTLSGIYAIQLAEKCQHTEKESVYLMQDKQMYLLMLRFGSLYSAIYEFLAKHNPNELMLLSDVFEKSRDELTELTRSLCRMSYNFENEFVNDHDMVESVSEHEMLTFIYDFLKLYQD